MLSELESVGNNLKKAAVSKSSASTLQKLGSYYEHQQDQMKGFEKDPKKLQGNLAIIDGWIHDIKQLTGALYN